MVEGAQSSKPNSRHCEVQWSGLLHWWGWWLDRPEGRISDLLWTQNLRLWFINQNVKKSSP